MDQSVVEGEVTVQPRFKTGNPENAKIGLEGVAAPGGRDGAQDCRLLQGLPYPLGGPEEEGQFVQGKVLTRKATVALTLGNGCLQVIRRDGPSLRGRQGDDAAARLYRFLDRRRLDTL